MSRYFYYIVILEFVGGVITITPSLLFDVSKEGALISILIALLAGGVFIYFTTRFFNQFPGLGFPELLQLHTPKWVASPLLILFSLVWFTIGLKTLINYAFLLKRFLTPQLQLNWIVFTLLLFISFSFFMQSKKLLYTLEIILLINLPLIIYIIGILYGNQGLEWDYVQKSIMYIYNTPNFLAFSASFLIFLGTANLVIFNREFKQKQKIKVLSLLNLVLLGTGIMFTIYFIPFGYNGFDRIQYMSFPWLLTTDSIKVAIAFLERVMYIFLFLNLSIAFLSINITWHVSMEIFKSTVSLKELKWKQINLGTYLFTLLVWIVSLLVSSYVSESQFLIYSSYLLKFLPPFFFVFLTICWFISWRYKHEVILKTN